MVVLGEHDRSSSQEKVQKLAIQEVGEHSPSADPQQEGEPGTDTESLGTTLWWGAMSAQGCCLLASSVQPRSVG